MASRLPIRTVFSMKWPPSLAFISKFCSTSFCQKERSISCCLGEGSPFQGVMSCLSSSPVSSEPELTQAQGGGQGSARGKPEKHLSSPWLQRWRRIRRGHGLSAGGNFDPQGTCGDSWLSHCGRCYLHPVAASGHRMMHGTAPATKNYSVPNVSSVDVEKP